MKSYRMLEDGLFIGPQPTEQDLKAAKLEGIKTVIDFRMPSETKVPNVNLVLQYGLDHVNIPVNRLALSEDQIDAFDVALTEHQGPFLLHCATGARAAMVLALSRARRHEWSAERTLQEAELMGYNLRSSLDLAGFITKTRGS